MDLWSFVGAENVGVNLQQSPLRRSPRNVVQSQAMPTEEDIDSSQPVNIEETCGHVELNGTTGTQFCAQRKV